MSSMKSCFITIITVLVMFILVGCGISKQPIKLSDQSSKIIKKDIYANISFPLPDDIDTMVLIPAGDFLMGSEDGQDDEKPVHKVYLDAFYIDKYEVTNAQYKKFIDATSYKPPENWNGDKVSESQADFSTPNKPVVNVSWEDAQAYCKWVGKRLPTEAEWEKSARGGLVGKKYPWGDDISHDKANYRGTDGKDSFGFTSPVGSFEPNGYGLYDMAGNVWEWCADLYSPDYYKSSPEKNPTGPLKGTDRVLRGGSAYWLPYALRVSARSSALQSKKETEIGFRCAKSAPEQR